MKTPNYSVEYDHWNATYNVYRNESFASRKISKIDVQDIAEKRDMFAFLLIIFSMLSVFGVFSIIVLSKGSLLWGILLGIIGFSSFSMFLTLAILLTTVWAVNNTVGFGWFKDKPEYVLKFRKFESCGRRDVERALNNLDTQEDMLTLLDISEDIPVEDFNSAFSSMVRYLNKVENISDEAAFEKRIYASFVAEAIESKYGI